ncbi:MAG: hypothetical protein CSA96_08800 [Bacteroidetes bacterium]|nr:MAG: hypothetical protein CSA96_08800 [Bacteroidota bacterium]
MNFTRPLLLLALLVFVPGGCRRPAPLPETIEVHHLNYQVSYLEDKAGEIPTRILPKQMEAYFSRHYIYTRIEGFFKQFSLTQVADLKRRQVTTMLHFFGTKVYYSGKPGELPAGVISPKKLSFSRTGLHKTIGGLDSEHIIARMDDGSFDFYFTDDFSIRRPNINTPYQELSKPLTVFRIRLSELDMLLTCKAYEFTNISGDLLKVPAGYKPVSKASMEDIINSLFTKD